MLRYRRLRTVEPTLRQPSTRTRRACAFCGNPADSGEHLLAEWLQRVLPSDEQMIHFRQLGADANDRREWHRLPFREDARIVCKTCNSGWMSDLEKAAQPVLERPIRREASTFGTPHQTILATWALKTALVFQASQNVRIAPTEHFSLLPQRRTPPRSVAVWLGSHYRARSDASNSVFVQRPLSLESLDGRIDADELREQPFGYLNFLAVGGVSFLILGHRFSNRIDVEYDGPLADALIRIWPHRASVVPWPPRHMMDQDLLQMLTLAPSGFIASVWPAP